MNTYSAPPSDSPYNCENSKKGQPRSVLLMQFEVLYALILHDIKARFFGNGLGYVVNMLWPYAHIIVIVIPFAIGGRAVPYGNSASLYVATGVLPFVAFNYVCRPMIMGGITNKGFLQYPIIKLNDILLARAALETLNVFLSAFLIYVTFLLFGIDPAPKNEIDAVKALIAALFLGFGVGYFNAVVSFAWPIWATISIIMTIIVYISCGIVINPDSLPREAVYYLSFNPVLHCVVWMRSTYYAGYGSSILSKTYIFSFAAISLVLGLIFEKLGRKLVLR